MWHLCTLLSWQLVFSVPGPAGPCDATGAGQPKGDSATAAVARIAAERTAFLDALNQASRCLTEQKKELGGWTIKTTRYYSDGGVEVDVSASAAAKDAAPTTAIGSAAADVKARGKSVAQVRLEAERAAVVEAKRNYGEAVDRVAPKGSDGNLRTRLSALVKGCVTEKVLYFADGGVSVQLRCGAQAGAAPAKPQTGDAQLLPR